MHPGIHAARTPDKPAYIMAGSGISTSYRELESASNQGAHLFRKLGLERGDHIAFLMENHPWFFRICWAAHRSGLYYTAISYRLQEEEVAYIVKDSGAKLFIASLEQASLADRLRLILPEHCSLYMLDGTIPGYDPWEEAVHSQPVTPIADQAWGADMLYSSGTTGRPKGVKRALSDTPFGADAEVDGATSLLALLYQINEDTVYLSPAPFYHSAPLRFNMGIHSLGGTAVAMEHFDSASALECIEKYRVTHSQWVPTMFVRMLKLPEEARTKWDLSSHRLAIHAAAPCPIEVKRRMIEWWGPIIHEYYAGTEGNGFCCLNSEEWLAHPGSVGKPLLGQVHIVGEDGSELPTGEIGTIYFSGGGSFEYHNDLQKTMKSRNEKGWSTLDDMGCVDEDGYLYLTDRKSFMIISGGVNIYPQETENLLITHPKVQDCAVIGVPNEEFGEEVKAVVQPVDMKTASDELADELMAFCREQLSHIKCPRSIDFVSELPRHPTGKLYKRLLRNRYWQGHTTGII